MSAEQHSKKRKDKKKKKEDVASLIEDEESGGGGFCSKIIFLVLLAALGLAVGVIFFELGGLHGPLGGDVETVIKAPEEHMEFPVDPTEDEDPFDNNIEPSPIPSDAPLDESNSTPEPSEEVESVPTEEVFETVVENLPEEPAESEEPQVEESLPEATPEPEPETVEPVEQPAEERPVETPVSVEEIVQEEIPPPPSQEESNFEEQLADDSAEVPQESFTMRAEREAVQEAVDQVWVLTVRCVEELRALQTLAKSSLTLSLVDKITQRLEPLRNELDELVRTTSDSIFEGALEQAAHLERSLRAVLDDLDAARLKEEAVAKEELFGEAEEPEKQPEESQEEEVLADEPEAEEVVTSEPEPIVQEDAVPEQLNSQSQEETVQSAPAEPEVVEQPESVSQPENEIEEPSSESLPVPPEQPEPASQPLADAVEPESQSNEPTSEPEEVVEPIQVATEAFTVQPDVEAEPATKPEENQPAASSPSPSQNLEEADRLVDESPSEALTLMEQILERDPGNPLALYGRARSLESLAEMEKSNARLEQAIFAYRAVLDLEERVDDDLFRRAALRCIDRMRFRGFQNKAIRIQQRLISRFPNEIDLQNQLAIGYLLSNQPETARTVLEGVLERWPESGFAQVHLGFILKTTYNDVENGVRLMKSGIASREEGVIDGRFYFHLGDGLTRLGRHEEAQQVYIEGEKEKLFLSRDQRSLYNVDRLTARPWWTKESTTYGAFFDLLESNWQEIRDEGVSLLTLQSPEGFINESENLRDKGDWKQFELFVRGKKNAKNCNQAPKTCSLIEDFPPALCKRGQVKFSIMHPATHVWPHTGPTNCRIRAHLGLVVPSGTSLRVSNTTRSWEEGKFIIFDDSFEHEVWHNGTSYRLVLIVDLWHPELTLEERRSLAPI